MTRLRVAAALLVVVCLAALPAIATTAPSRVGPTGATRLDRIFPEPLASTDFIQFAVNPATGKSQYLHGIAQLEQRYPDVVDVDPIGELVGMPELKSAGGREIPVITVTDESVPNEDKVDLYVSLSIHGLERAGLEGGTRFMEDLAAGWYSERAGGEKYLLANGDPKGADYRQMTATEVLREARIVFVNLNPDGWAAGDKVGPTAGYVRGNANRIDLNRQWPTLGFARSSGKQYETLSQPEAKAGFKLVEEHLGVPEGAADLHGENADDVLLAIMFPAGQFDPRGLAQQVSLAESIKYNVNHSAFPGAKGLLSGLGATVQPAEYHTAYDAIGYDDAGFQGDYLVQRGILEMDHEYIASNIVPNNAFVPALEQVHVDTTRELLKATIVTTIQAEQIDYTADLKGTVGYVENPEVLTEAGAPKPPFGFEQKPYESTSMQYYRDLGKYLAPGSSLVPVTSDTVADGSGLRGLDTLVITDRELPRYTAVDGSLASPDRAAFWGAVRAFAEAGGNVVLTDRGVQGVADLGIVPAGATKRVNQDAGKLTEINRDHELLRDVTGVIGQTYFEVPLGYPFGGDNSPAWGVDEAAWTAAGGTVGAYLGSIQQDGLLVSAKGEVPGTGEAVGLGTVKLGKGRVSVFGAVLPDATQAHPHTQGLADYAVTYAGNAILVNALTWDAPTDGPAPAAAAACERRNDRAAARGNACRG